MQPQRIIFPDLQQLSLAAAKTVIQEAGFAIRNRGSFYIALAGGSTPRSLYQLLADPEFSNRIDWSRVHIYFGDERMVPHDHPDSNYAMAKSTLLDHVPIPAEQIHPVPTDCPDAHECAATYADIIRKIPGQEQTPVPCLDLILLGMGDDGHTASLFPGTTILKENEKFAAAVYVEKFDAWRISLTYPVINHARKVLFLVGGADKASALLNIFSADSDPEQFPAKGVKPKGELVWYVDQKAAQKIIKVSA